MEDVVRHLEARIATLDKSGAYLAEGLCGEDYWEILGLEDHLRNKAGLMISKIAEHRLLPIAKVGKTSANAWLYQIV